ncbi:hypothetical protein H0H87_012303, partial [Tephrocybe sp. NHM501043]
MILQTNHFLKSERVTPDPNAFGAGFPTELNRYITEFATTSDLLVLAQVSRTFQELAEDILYYYVNLQHCFSNRRMAMIWCSSVISNQRRAHCVYSLKFPSTFKTPLTEDFDLDVQETIAKAFNAIVNLKHLWLLGVGEKYTASLHPSTLKDCTFSLTYLGGQTSSFSADDMWDFLSKHPDIEYWAPTVQQLGSVSAIPSHVVPNLRRAVIVDPTKIRSLSGRPIDSLCLVFASSHNHTVSAGLDAITALQPISTTLRTLVYTHGPLVGWSTIDMLQHLGRCAPNLKSLTYSTFGRNGDMTTRIADRRALVEATSQFWKLETLILSTLIETIPSSSQGPREAMTTQERLHDWSATSLNPIECREVASLFMKSSASLIELSLPFESGRGVKLLTYVRSDSDTREA